MPDAHCDRCGLAPRFGWLRRFVVGVLGALSEKRIALCEYCHGDLARINWTPRDWYCARTNHETVQVHELHRL